MPKYYWVTRDADSEYCLWDEKPEFDPDGYWDSTGMPVCDFCVKYFHALTNILLPKGKKGIMRIKRFRVVK